MLREVMAETPREVLCEGEKKRPVLDMVADITRELDIAILDRMVHGIIEIDAQCDPNGLRGRSLLMVWVDDASFVPPAMPVTAHDPVWNQKPGPRFK